MKYFFDTSVLIAAFLLQHEHHEPSALAYLRAEKRNSCCAAHTFAEVYATLTRLPGKHRAGLDQALVFLGDMRQRLTVITLEENDYHDIIEYAAAQGVVGGTIYDALLAKCALKANATRILTWDVNHFRLIGPEVARRVRTPGATPADFK